MLSINIDEKFSRFAGLTICASCRRRLYDSKDSLPFNEKECNISFENSEKERNQESEKEIESSSNEKIRTFIC